MYKLVVLVSVLALAVANPLAPFGWAGHAALAAPAAIAAPWAGLAAPFGHYGHYNYRGPLSLAPGQPANVVAADGRPLDTLDVNLDRAAHYTARAVDGGHLLKKRSAPFLAPVAVSHTARVDYPAHFAAAAPLGWHGAPYAAPFGVAHWAAPAPLAHYW